MTAVAETLERIHSAGDAHAMLRAALDAGLAVTGGTRGAVGLIDRVSGTLYVALGVGIAEPSSYELPVQFGARRDHPLLAAVRDGAAIYLGPADLGRRWLSPLRRMGFRQAAVVPLLEEIVISPCLKSRRCLSPRCPLRPAAAAAFLHEADWDSRVLASCARGTVAQARGVLVLDTPDAPDAEQQRELQRVSEIAARGLHRFPDFAVLSGEATADEVQDDWARRAFAAVHDPVIAVDMKGQIVFANARARTLFIAYEDDAEGRRRAVNLNRMLLDAWLASHLSMQPHAGQLELSLVDPTEGTELLFELLPSTAFNATLGEAGVVIALKDVSDIRRVVDELETTLRRVDLQVEQARHERDQLSLVLENIGQPIVVADPKANILRMNHAAERLLRPPRATSERERDLVRRNDAVITSLLSQIAMGRSDTPTEVTLSDPASGVSHVYAASAASARGALGGPAAVVLVLADLTALRELERRRLERQLFESEKLVATGRLAASIAHEINNPLEALKNALYVLASQMPGDDPQRRFIEIARSETQRISRIVRQFLGFYRPSVMRVPTDVNALVGEVLELLDAQLRKSRVRTEVAREEALPRIVASPDQLRQVILNLLLNAIQAMPRGGSLSIVTRTSVDGDDPERGKGTRAAGSVIVEVRDSGEGISPEIQARLFEPFFTTKEKTGTGLGLWVCQEIVHGHGGSIRVRSAPGVGSTFSVTLPIGAGVAVR